MRPISLIGFSLGARVIFYALDELAKQKAFGIVQDVYLFGTTVTAPRATWMNARSVVSGRFVNAFATNDWVLGYLFRATSGGLSTVAGLRAIENVPGLENVDVTSMIAGHMSYRPCMPALLEFVGLPITADWFDEPDVSRSDPSPIVQYGMLTIIHLKDPELDLSIQKRTVVNEQEEEQRKAKSKLWGLFPRKQGSTSGQSTPKVNPPPSFSHPSSSGKAEEYDEGEDDGDIGKGGVYTPPVSTPSSRLAVPNQPITQPSSAANSTADLPATAGFDFKKISDVLGKNVDPEEVTLPQPSIVVPESVRQLRDRAPLERAESAPPLDHQREPASSSQDRSTSPAFPRDPPSRPNTSVSQNDNEPASTTTAARVPDFSNEWASAAPETSTASQSASTRAARGFPSHVLQSATNIFSSKDLETPSHFDDSIDVDERDDDDEGGDIGGFGRESKDASAGWSTYPERKAKDDWALSNPW